MVGIDDICGHEAPAWKSESDSLIMVDLSESGMPGLWEQFWAKRVGSQNFLVCCIPFFAHGLALGDEVVAGPKAGFEWVVKSVLRPSENSVVRVLFREDAMEWETRERQDELIRNIREFSFPFEVLQLGYVAISCPAGGQKVGEMKEVLAAFESLEWSRHEILNRDGDD